MERYRQSQPTTIDGPRFMRRINIRLLGLLMLAAMLTSGLAYGVHKIQITRSADGLLRAARQARERQDFSEAIEFLDRYISLVPENNTGPTADMALLQADLGP